jgi:hypothetical protein
VPAAFSFTELILPDSEDDSDEDWSLENTGDEEDETENVDVNIKIEDEPRLCTCAQGVKTVSRRSTRVGRHFRTPQVKPANTKISADIYNLAAHLEIPILKQLCLNSLWSDLHQMDLRSIYFVEVVDDIYTHSAICEHGIRDLPARLLAAAYVNDSMGMEVIEPIMQKHRDLAVRIFKFIAQLRHAGGEFGKNLDEEAEGEEAGDEDSDDNMSDDE